MGGDLMAVVFNGNVGVFQNTVKSTIIPIGTTAQRPASPEAGMIRFNTDENAIEIYDGTGWTTL